MDRHGHVSYKCKRQLIAFLMKSVPNAMNGTQYRGTAAFCMGILAGACKHTLQNNSIQEACSKQSSWAELSRNWCTECGEKAF